MKKLNATLTKIGLASALTLAAPSLALADDYDYGSSAAAGTAVAGLVGFWLVFVLIMATVGIGLLIFWIIMLVDAFKRTNWQDDSQKTTWLVILVGSIFVGLSGLAAIIYYFVVKKALDKGSSAPASTTPPAVKK